MEVGGGSRTTASARKIFWMFEPSAFATAISVLPRRASMSDEARFANDVPTAATVRPTTADGMWKSVVSWSAVQQTAYENAASHAIERLNAASLVWFCVLL